MFNNYPEKVDPWLENLIDRNESQMTTLQTHTWSVCTNTEDNDHGFVDFSSMTLNFLDNACTKIQNMAFKTSKMDQLQIHI